MRQHLDKYQDLVPIDDSDSDGGQKMDKPGPFLPSASASSASASAAVKRPLEEEECITLDSDSEEDTGTNQVSLVSLVVYLV